MSTRVKVIASLVVVTLALGFIGFAVLSGGESLEYFKHVDDVLQEPHTWFGRVVKLHGNVVAKTIHKRPGSLDFKFGLHYHDKWVDVLYSGVVPDSFRDCAELVVKGELKDEFTFAASSLEAKCPSKYDKVRQEACGQDLSQQVLARRQR